MRDAFTVLWLLLLLCLAPQPVRAMDWELGGGATFDRYQSLHESGVITTSLITQTASRFPTEWSLGYIFGQEKNPDDAFNNDDPVFWGGVGKRLEWKFLVLGLGIVAVNQTSQRLSTAINFKSQAGLRLGPCLALVQHISNAGMHGANDGETFFTVNLRLPLDW